jgi:hypothetical protein
MKSLLLAIATFLVPPASARWRWEDFPIIGMFCIPAFEPYLCVKNRTKYYLEDFCENDPIDPDPQLVTLLKVYYESGNTDNAGELFERGWLDDCVYCAWDGIECNDGVITKVDICKLHPYCIGKRG